MQKLLRNFTFNPKNDILSGLTVALALVPEAVAFAFVAGIDPLVGLYGAFMMGLITAVFGGRPGMISGATGAMAVVMVHLIQKGNEVGVGLAVPIENLGLQWLFIVSLNKPSCDKNITIARPFTKPIITECGINRTNFPNLKIPAEI